MTHFIAEVVLDEREIGDLHSFGKVIKNVKSLTGQNIHVILNREETRLELKQFLIRLYWDHCDDCGYGIPVFWSERHKTFHHNKYGTKKRPSGGPCSASTIRKEVMDTFGKIASLWSENEPELDVDENDELDEADKTEVEKPPKENPNARRNRKRRDKKTASSKYRSSYRSKTRKA